MYHPHLFAGLLNKLWKLKHGGTMDHDDHVSNKWQRFINAKSIVLCIPVFSNQVFKFGFKKLSMLRLFGILNVIVDFYNMPTRMILKSLTMIVVECINDLNKKPSAK